MCFEKNKTSFNIAHTAFNIFLSQPFSLVLHRDNSCDFEEVFIFSVEYFGHKIPPTDFVVFLHRKEIFSLTTKVLYLNQCKSLYCRKNLYGQMSPVCFIF